MELNIIIEKRELNKLKAWMYGFVFASVHEFNKKIHVDPRVAVSSIIHDVYVYCLALKYLQKGYDVVIEPLICKKTRKLLDPIKKIKDRPYFRHLSFEGAMTPDIALLKDGKIKRLVEAKSRKYRIKNQLVMYAEIAPVRLKYLIETTQDPGPSFFVDALQLKFPKYQFINILRMIPMCKEIVTKNVWYSNIILDLKLNDFIRFCDINNINLENTFPTLDIEKFAQDAYKFCKKSKFDISNEPRISIRDPINQFKFDISGLHEVYLRNLSLMFVLGTLTQGGSKTKTKELQEEAILIYKDLVGDRLSEKMTCYAKSKIDDYLDRQVQFFAVRKEKYHELRKDMEVNPNYYKYLEGEDFRIEGKRKKLEPKDEEKKRNEIWDLFNNDDIIVFPENDILPNNSQIVKVEKKLESNMKREQEFELENISCSIANRGKQQILFATVYVVSNMFTNTIEKYITNGQIEENININYITYFLRWFLHFEEEDFIIKETMQFTEELVNTCEKLYQAFQIVYKSRSNQGNKKEYMNFMNSCKMVYSSAVKLF
jgi:hypothetical protein